MTSQDHERAVDLITRRGVEEEVPGADAAWLEAHLESCPECSEYAAACESTGRLLREVAVTASPSLVRATQLRLRARAAELDDQRSRAVLIAVSFCLGALSSGLSAWLWWKFGGWVAQKLALPASIVGPGVFVAWMLTAVIVAVGMLASSHPVIDRSLTLSWLEGKRQGGRL